MMPQTQSLPTRERGLKSPPEPPKPLDPTSLPTRERGLKYLMIRSVLQQQKVAPYAGAWIEIGIAATGAVIKLVAPYAGAWIEIENSVKRRLQQSSRSLRGSVD